MRSKRVRAKTTDNVKPLFFLVSLRSTQQKGQFANFITFSVVE